jgi:hypothetical protein
VRKSQIIEWVQKEFFPLELATPIETIEQIFENAVRYHNTHSAVPEIVMVGVNPNSIKVELPLSVKNVAQVYPSAQVGTVMQNHPMWTLLGIQILDNVTSDLINVSTAFSNYKTYIGNDFRWTFVDAGNPTLPSYLMVTNSPVGADKLCVVGTKRLFTNDDVVHEHILEWLLQYVKALVKMSEGRLLRVTSLIDVKNDGAELVREGLEEKKALEERLGKESMWVLFGKRF